MALALSDEWNSRTLEASDLFDALLRELLSELGSAHSLAGHIRSIEARHLASDRIVVLLNDDSYALVHLTWSGRSEGAQFPSWEPLGARQSAAEALRDFDARW